jgi:hypothetical protein
MEQVPTYLKLFFIGITILAFWQLYRCTKSSKQSLWLVSIWLLLQTVLGVSGFYLITTGAPPRFALCLLPPMAFILMLFLTPKGRQWIDSLDLQQLILLHAIRIPVELGLYGLYLNHAIPKLMTFEGINFDVLSGLSAPLIFYFAFIRKTIGRNALLAWNFICLGLLINIVGHAIAAAPFDFQSIAFDQPNRAIFYFPFVWLPAFVVPAVLLAHLAAIRQLLVSKNNAFNKADLLSVQNF